MVMADPSDLGHGKKTMSYIMNHTLHSALVFTMMMIADFGCS